MPDPIVTSEKPAIPTLWLDTSAVIKITKIEKGEVLQQIEIERLTKLRELVEKLVGEGKLLCPQADQEEEYAAERLDREVHSQFAGLSLGIKLRHRQGIYDYQIQCAMKAKIEGAKEIKLPCSDYFYDDPVEELKEAREKSFVITTNVFKTPEIIAERVSAKDKVSRVWEEIRQENVAHKKPYEDQLKAEWNAYADAMVQLVTEFEEKVKNGQVDFTDFMRVEGFMFYRIYWNDIKGQPPDWRGVYDFFCSSYYHNLPTTRIRCQLGADLITGQQPILSGDSMDVELLAVAIPLSHYVLTDKKMEARIKRLGIDKEWGTQVYSMSSVNGLFAELAKL